MEKWITEELEKTDLGEKRRTNQLLDLLRNCKNYFLLSQKHGAETWFLNINYSLLS